MKELLNQSDKQCGFKIDNGIIKFCLYDEYVDSYGLLTNFVLFKIKPKVYVVNKLNIATRTKDLDLAKLDEGCQPELTFFRN